MSMGRVATPSHPRPRFEPHCTSFQFRPLLPRAGLGQVEAPRGWRRAEPGDSHLHHQPKLRLQPLPEAARSSGTSPTSN